MTKTILYPRIAPRGLDASEVAPPAFDPATDGFPYLPQQAPIKHRRFAAELTGRMTGFAVETVEIGIGQVQPQIPTPHKRFAGFTPDISQPLEPTLFETVIEEVTLDKWFRPQQEPVKHLRYQSSPSVVAGAEPSLLEAFTQNLAWALPQSLPQPIGKRKPWRDQYTRGYDNVEFVPPGQFDPATGFSWPVQQAPIKHRRFDSPTVVITGIQPTLLEIFSQDIAWAQPQALPQPIKYRKPWLDQYVKGMTDAEIAPPFDVATFVYPPQSPPGRHKRFQGWQEVIAGAEMTLFDPFTQNVSWIQPQADPLPIAKRCVYLDQYIIGLEPSDFAITNYVLCVCVSQGYIPGVQAADIFVPGAYKSQGHIPGAQAAQGQCGC